MKNSAKGNWFKTHRQLFDNKLWLSEPFTKGQAWLDIFGNANHQEGIFWVRGNEVRLKRGQLGWSELTMAKRWRWSKNKVRRFLNWLETEQQIEQQKTFITTIITVINYDKYQETEQQTIQQKDSRRYTNKNDKNVKNDKNIYIATAEAVAVDGGNPVNDSIALFKEVNPAYTKIFKNTTQRSAVERLHKLLGAKEVDKLINLLTITNQEKYAPVITTPLQLEEKLGALSVFIKKSSLTPKGSIQTL